MSVILATTNLCFLNFLAVLVQFSSVRFHNLIFHYMQFEKTIMLKMAARNYLPRYAAFFNRILIESLWIRCKNAMHLPR